MSGQTRVHNNPVTCDNYQPITCLSSSIQERSEQKREPDFWGTLSRSYFVSHDTMLEQFSVSDRKLGRGGGDTGVFLSLLLMVYIPHLSHRGSSHHLPSLANCLTFQFCLLCCTGIRVTEMWNGDHQKREKTRGSQDLDRSPVKFEISAKLGLRLLMPDHKGWAKIMELLQISAIGEYSVYIDFIHSVVYVR